jgi:hypothetical protein
MITAMITTLNNKPLLAVVPTAVTLFLKFVVNAAPIFLGLSAFFSFVIGALTVWLMLRKTIRDWKAGLKPIAKED